MMTEKFFIFKQPQEKLFVFTLLRFLLKSINVDINISVMNLISVLLTACNDTTLYMDKWLSRLDASNWMSHVKDTLDCACLVAQCLDKVSSMTFASCFSSLRSQVVFGMRSSI